MSTRGEVVADELLDAIVAGRFRAGEALPAEGALAQELEVSRLTVREASKTLVARGILQARQGSGTYVVDPADWVDLAGLVALEGRRRGAVELEMALLEVRRMLEVGSAGLAAARRTPAQLDALTASVEALSRAHDANDVDAAVEADMAFHDLVIECAANPFVVATYAPLRDELVRARRRTSAIASTRGHALEQHRRILTALRLGSPDAAKAAMRAHMEQTSNDILAQASH